MWAVQKITGVSQRGLAGEEQQFFLKIVFKSAKISLKGM